MGFGFLSVHFFMMGWGWGLYVQSDYARVSVCVLDCRYPHPVLPVSQSVLEYQILCVFSSLVMAVLCIY